MQQPTPTLTNEECKVVEKLIDLLELAYSHGDHRNDCRCAFCVQREELGNVSFKVYDALREKVGGRR